MTQIIINGRKYNGSRKLRNLMGHTREELISMSDEKFANFLAEKSRKLKQTHSINVAKKKFSEETRPIKILRKYFRDDRHKIPKKDCSILGAAFPDRDKLGGWINFNARKSSRQSSFELSEASILDDPIKAFEILASIAKAEAKAPRILINYRADR